MPFLVSMHPRALAFSHCNSLLLRDFQLQLEAQTLQRRLVSMEKVKSQNECTFGLVFNPFLSSDPHLKLSPSFNSGPWYSQQEVDLIGL